MEYNLNKEPKLEEYGLDVSSYENYRKQKIDLETNFTKFKSEIEDSNPNRFGLTPYLFFAVGFLGSIFSLIYGNYTLSFIFGSLLLLGYIFESIDSASSDKNVLIVNSKKAEIDKKIEFIKSKVFQFEEDCIKYYLNFCDEFYKNNIFRKHSNTDKYKKSAETLALIKDEIIVISQKIVFEHKNLNVILNGHINCLYRHISYYKNNLNHFFNTFDKIKFRDETEYELKNYLKNKATEVQTIDITKKVAGEILKEVPVPIVNTINIKENVKQIQTSNESTISEINNDNNKGFRANLMNDVRSEIEEANTATNIKEIINTINIVSPEKKYSSPRKIDWENINKDKSVTGLKGEEIAVEIEKEYLKSINREDLAEKVKQVSIDGDGAGYDILSYFPDGQEKYIEVKSSKNSNSNSFNISSNELDFMKRNQYNYQIWRIFNINENDNTPTLKVHKANDILTFKKITPVQYVVKME